MADRVDVILELTRQLSQLVAREMELIEAREAHRLTDLEEERSRFSLLYTREMQAANRAALCGPRRPRPTRRR